MGNHNARENRTHFPTCSATYSHKTVGNDSARKNKNKSPIRLLYSCLQKNCSKVNCWLENSLQDNYFGNRWSVTYSYEKFRDDNARKHNRQLDNY